MAAASFLANPFQNVMKEDIVMDVEPCYPWFSAELESAEALASSQQKF